MSNVIHDKQKVAFNNLLKKQLPDLMAQHSFQKDGIYDVHFELYPCDVNAPYEEYGTRFVIIKARCTISNLESGEEEEIIIDLLKLPVYEELGFRINNNYIQVLDSYDRAPGWSFSYDAGKKLNMAKLSSISANYGGGSSTFKKTIRFKCGADNLLTFTTNRKRESGNKADNLNEVSISTFFRAITGLSNSELLEMFGLENPYNIVAFGDSAAVTVESKHGCSINTRTDCINALAKAMISPSELRGLNTITQKQERIQRTLFDKRYMNLGDSNYGTLNNLQSFKKRGINKTLAEDVKLLGETIVAGTILTESILERLDLSPVDEIIVSFNGKRFSLKKFSNLTFRALGYTLDEDTLDLKKGTILDVETLHHLNNSQLKQLKVISPDGIPTTLVRRISADVIAVEDLYTAYSIFINNVNGFDTYDSQYELTDRIVVPFDTKVCQLVNSNLDYVCNAIQDNLNYLKEPASMDTVSYLEDHYSTRELQEDEVSEEAKEIERSIEEKNRAIANAEIVSGDQSIINVISDFAQNINVDAFLLSIRSSDDPENQMSDLTNIMAYQERNFKITPNFGNSQMIKEDMIAIQAMQFGRLDPMDQPESSKIGVVHHRTVLSKENENGYLTTPFYLVDKCKVSEEPVYLSANEELDKYVAEWNETFYDENGNKKDRVNARFNGTVVTVDADAVTLKEFSPIQTMSPARLNIPFMNHSAGKRIQMACNHQKQAIPTFGVKRATVGTGGECILDYGNYKASTMLQEFYDSHVIVTPELEKYKDTILNDSLSLVSIRSGNCMRSFLFVLNDLDAIVKKGDLDVEPYVEVSVPFMQNTPEKCIFSYRINAQKGNHFSGDDIVLFNLGYDPKDYKKEVLADYGGFKVDPKSYDTAMALGQDLMVAFKTFGSTTIDDSITISSRLVYDQTLSSITIFQVEEELHNSSTCVEEFWAPAIYGDSYFGSNGLPKLGIHLRTGDACISKIATNYLKDGRQEKKQKLTYLGPAQEGQVVSAEIIEKNNKKVAKVLLATKSDIDVGDKMSGRCGNKGVIARIVPEYEMPYNPRTGETADVCLNPQGVPSRMNISQLLELTLGLAMHRKGEIAIISPFNSDGEDFVREMAEQQNVHPEMLMDGRSGHYFERPINYGIMHMLKMTHMVKKKIHSIGMVHPVDAVTLQPKHGAKRDGGQAFGEMESWCLQGVGAVKLLQEIQSTASDDRLNRTAIIEAMEQDPYNVICTGDNLGYEQNNSNDATFQVFARSVGTEITTEQDNVGEMFYQFRPLKDETIRTLSYMPVKSPNALHNKSIFGRTDTAYWKARTKSLWGWIDLGTEIILPTWFYKGELPKLILMVNDSSAAQIIVPMSKNTWMRILDRKSYARYSYGDSCVSVIDAEDFKALESPEGYTTGLDCLVSLLKTYDVSTTLSYLERKVTAKQEKVKTPEDEEKLLPDFQLLNYVRSFVESDVSLSDYVVTAYPVMPAIFRPESTIASMRNSKSDFDWHYTQILNAVNVYNNSQTEDSKRQIFDAIANMIGLRSDKKAKSSAKHQNIISYFFGNKASKRKDHGKIRETQQKKRICRSGRSTIIPAQDPGMFPTEIGIPLIMAVKLWDIQLQAHMQLYAPDNAPFQSSDWGVILEALANHNDSRFNSLYQSKFSSVFKLSPKKAKALFLQRVRDFVEGTHGQATGPNGIVISPQVVLCGRQPSLHCFSIRAFYPKVVLTKSIQMHHLVCKGYNADFDGDQTWVYAPIFEETKEEALQLLSVNAGVINPKNNGIILEHSQDIALGVYCATMLKNNKEDLDEDEKRNVFYYDSLDSITSDIDARVIHLYDLVCYTHTNGKKYLSTAGRILFNSLLPNGFTEEPFSNVLGLPVKADRYCDLYKDGLITSGSSNSKILKSYKLQDICESTFRDYGTMPYGRGKYDSTIGSYQGILEFGFKYADFYGISISIEDLAQISVALNKDEVISQADSVKALIEKDYQDGLVAEEDKKTAIANLYVGANKTIGDKLLRVMDRNNNIFIMFDSGARGSKNQIVQTCGAIGILQKTGSENLETSVTTNYYDGLSSYDLQQTSYSTRLSVASTQNETRNAGHATRQSVYMESGLEIVEKDCGKKDWWFDILWGQPIKEKSLFKPDLQFFMSSMNGKRVWDKETAALFGDSLTEDGIITPSSFNRIEDGFQTIRVEGESQQIKISEDTTAAEFGKIIGCKLLTQLKLPEGTLYNGLITDSLLPELKRQGITSISVMDYKEYSFNDLLNSSNLKVLGPNKALIVLDNFLDEDNKPKHPLEMLIHKNFIKTLDTNLGTFEFRYKMTEACRSLLTGRVARNLKYLEVYKDPEFLLPNEKIEIITDKTLDYIEDTGIDRIEARVLLDCESGRDESKHGKSKHGVCSCCYGLRFSNRKLPRIGDNIGVEAAQAIGEPAAQLTMNLVHSGGAAGASISGGVQLFDSLLHGNKIDNGAHDAYISDVNGYVKVIQVDGLSNLAVIPYNKHCAVCDKCTAHDLCDFYGKVSQYSGNCILPTKVLPKMIKFKDGEWVNAGDALTEGYVLPQNIKSVGESNSTKELIRKKQMVCLLNYFNTFKGNNIYINARHFEILARLQNGTVVVTSSDDSDYVPGKRYEYSEILHAGDGVKFIMQPISQSEVITQNSGALSLLSFENVLSHIATFTNGNYKSYRNSQIGRISVGENLTKNQRKVLLTSRGSEVKVQESVPDYAPNYVKILTQAIDKAAPVDLGKNLLDGLASLDLNSITKKSSHSITGQVFNSEIDPVRFAEIKLCNSENLVVSSVDSDASGKFKFTDVESGSYTLTIEVPAFEKFTKAVTLDDGSISKELGSLILQSKDDPDNSLDKMSLFDNVSSLNNEVQKPSETEENIYNNLEEIDIDVSDFSEVVDESADLDHTLEEHDTSKLQSDLNVSGMHLF